MQARLIIGALTAGLLCGLPGAGQAQTSSEDMLRALTPAPGIHTRGIRPSAPDAGAPDAGPASGPAASPGAAAGRSRPSLAAGMHPPRTPPQVDAQAGSGELNIFIEFRTGSSQLTPAAMRVLDNLGRALTSDRLQGFRFRVEGHTDTVGSEESNKALSEARAESVVRYLTGKFQIDRARLEAVGLGETDLLVPTPPQTPEARNRRVRVVNLGA